ncbi:vWA domain-containing protein [Bacillus sp. T3]|uniref:vWA domain-containing protein n=1 Tax=Bacillus sp. T3 TaxID=467262 RepID=UPI002981915C|nr:vWA domain-containing protein [Bacillus sp. T3]
MLKKRISSILVVICFTSIMNPITTLSESPLVSTSRIEAVLVVDVSRSMLESDPNKISNEAMKMFVDMASLKGDKIGVIAYANEVMSKQEIIKLTTQQNKTNLKNFIDSLDKFPNTDLSIGVKEAISVLEHNHEQNYRPLIVLLADGNNDLKRNSSKTTQQASDDLNAAVAYAKEKNYPIYVIGLNAKGNLNKEILQRIAQETNGKFFETSTTDNLPGFLTEIFADHLKLKVLPINDLIGTGDFQEVPINFPNENILEANISFISNQPVELKLFNPDGKEIAIPSDNTLLSRSTAYSMLKLNNPIQGNWTLKVKGAPQDKIEINLVFNYDLQLKLAPIETKNLKKGDVVHITAAFEEDGKAISNLELYQSMKSTLFVKDLKSGKIENIELKAEKQGFTGQFIIGDSENYEVMMKAEGDSFYRETQPQKILVQKTASPADTSKVNQSSFAIPPSWVYGVIVLVILIAAIIYLFRKGKKKNRVFTGKVIVEIKDENTGELSKPQSKKLTDLKGEFILRELFKLDPAFSETDLITFAPLTNNALAIFNKSNCNIELNGVALEPEPFHRFRRNDYLRIKLNETNQTISVKITSLEKK